MKIHDLEVTGSLIYNGVNLLSLTSSVTDSGSFSAQIVNLNQVSSSLNSFTSSINTTIKNKLDSESVISGSAQVLITGTTGYSTFSSSISNSIGDLSSSVGSLSSSIATTTSNLSSRIGSVETKTGSYATTGSNIFVGSQVITGSLYITNDMVVQGCSCLQNITASAVSIGTNTVVLNTATPAVRFAGVSVQDSGSNAGVTGSIYWDGLCNRWVYSNPSGIGYSGGMLLSGPRTSTLGSESPLTCNYLAKSGGGDHLYDSCIYEMSGSMGINTSSPAVALHVDASGGGIIRATRLGSGLGYVQLEADGTNGTLTSSNGLLINTGGSQRVNITSTGISCFACTVCVPNIVSTGTSGGRYATFSAPSNGGYITFDAGGTAFGDLGSYCAQYSTGDATTLLLGSRAGYALALGTNSTERLRITSGGNVGIGTNVPASLLSAYNTTSTALLQMAMGLAENGTGGGNRGFDASFTSTKTSFTGTDSADQGYGYFPLTIVNGQTYTIHFKSTAVNGYLGTIITSTGTNFATSAVQTISLPTITDGALTSIRFTASGAASYIGFAGYRTSGTMSLTVSEVSVVSGIPDIETGAMVAYKGIATNRINIQAPTTSCVPTLGCADCTTGLIVSNFDTNYGMLLGTLNTGVGWIQQARYDGTATSYALSLNPNGGNVGIGTTSPDRKLDISSANAADTKLVIRTACGFAGAYSPSLDFHVGGYESTCTTGQIKMCGANNYSGDMIFSTQLSGTINPLVERMRIGSTGTFGFNCSGVAARTMVVKGATGCYIVAEFIEPAGVHSMFLYPNKNSTNHISSDYMSGGVYLPLSLSGRECTTDLVLGINGNIGINNGNPQAMLDVTLTPNAVAKTRNTCFGSCGLVFLSGLQGTTNSEVGIFGGNALGSLSAGIGMARANSGDWDTHLRFYTHIPSTSGNPADITEKMRIIGNGNVGIGLTVPGQKLSVQGDANNWTANIIGSTTAGQSLGLLVTAGLNSNDVGLLVQKSDSSTTYFQIRGDGYLFSSPTYNNLWPGYSANMYVTSDGSFGRITASSLRYKENINEWNGNGLDTILALKPKTFKYKKDYYNNPDNIDFLGLIAEDVAEVLPYLAQYENIDRTGLVENVRYDTIVVPLIAAIQEQQCIICSQSSMINTLKTCLGIM